MYVGAAGRRERGLYLYLRTLFELLVTCLSISILLVCRIYMLSYVHILIKIKWFEAFDEFCLGFFSATTNMYVCVFVRNIYVWLSVGPF